MLKSGQRMPTTRDYDLPEPDMPRHIVSFDLTTTHDLSILQYIDNHIYSSDLQSE